jgi:hypothetical protein
MNARIPVAFCLLFAAIFNTWKAKAKDNDVTNIGFSLAQQKGCSSDGAYCVELVPTHGYPDEAILRVSDKRRTFAEFGTFGYLLGVIFSPKSRYVAVNNRRANAGDYLWVISLTDGSPIKIPDDVEWAKRELGKIAGDHSPSEVMPEVRRLCSDCTADGVQHRFLFTHGWNSPNELTVIEELQFREGWIAVKKRCRVVAGGIILVGHTAEKEDGPSEVVRRAWTWSPFHSK